MKFNKLILFLITLFVTIVVIYFVLNNSSEKNIGESIENRVENIKAHNPSTGNLKTVKNIDKTEKTVNPYLQLKEDSEKWADVQKTCGYNDSDLRNKLDKNNNIELSKSQVMATNSLIDQCNEWFDYLNSLSSEQLKLLKDNIKDIFELTKYFFNDFKPYSAKILDEAKEYINKGGDASGVTQSVLAHLMEEDLNFDKVIAINLGTQDLDYIINNSYNISMLYSCEVEPNECSADSMMMSSWCIEDARLCGQSYTDYYARTITPNHFADLINIVRIIKELVNQGYFDPTKNL